MLAMDLSRSNEELNNLDDNESLLNVSDIKIENVFENEDSVPRELILPNGWFPNFSLNVSTSVIVETKKIKVLEDGIWNGFFYMYGIKTNNKYICLTPGCDVMPNKLRIDGVHKRTITDHAKKHHLVDLKVNQDVAVKCQPITCQNCYKTFTRQQNLKAHILSKHQNINSESRIIFNN